MEEILKLFKQASLWQAPPAMVTRIQKNVLNVYASSLMYIVKEKAKKLRNDYPLGKEKTTADEKIDYLKEIFLEAKKNTNWPAMFPQNTTQFYNIDLTGWKYNKPDIDKLLKFWLREGLYDPMLTVKIIFEHNSNGIRGNYDHTIKTIKIFIFDKYLNVSNIEEFLLYKSTIIRTVEHELEHFGQYVLGDLLRKKIS